MARIRERSPGVFEVTLSVGQDRVTGKRRQVSRTVRTGATKTNQGKGWPRAVLLEAAKMEAELDADRAEISATTATVAVVFERYCHHQEARGRAPKTLLEYRRFAAVIEGINLGSASRPVLIGTIPLSHLTAAHIDELQLRLQARGLSDTSRHHYHAFLSQALNQAVRWEWIPRNPANRAEAPSLRPAERDIPTPAQVQALLRSVAEVHPDLGAFILVAATTGARRGEMCALRWSDIDLEAGRMVIPEAISDLPYRLGGPRRKDTKTHRKRPLAVDVMTAAVLDAQRERAESRCAALEVDLAPDAYVWSQEADHSEFWRPARVTDAFATVRNAAGLGHVQLRDLRHWAASYMLAGGIDAHTGAGRLGNSTTVFLTRYAHRIPVRDEAAADILGALLAV